MAAGHPHRRARLSLALPALVLAIGGCCTSGAARTATGAGTTPLGKGNLQCDVKIVTILKVVKDGQPTFVTFPPLVQVRQNVQIVVWAGDVDMLTVKFVNHPFAEPDPVVCPGNRFCAALVPPTKYDDQNPSNNTYKYSLEIVADGKPFKIDPHLEVVK